MTRPRNRGFTMIEILMAVGIMTVLAGVGMSNYFSYQNKQAVEGAASALEGTLIDVQQRSISQDRQSGWGVYINAVSSSSNYYEVFYGASYSSGTVYSHTVLPANVQFSVPAQGNTMEIDFAEVTGMPNDAFAITLISTANKSITKSISINATTGLVSYFTGMSSAPSVSSISPNSASANNGTVSVTNLAGAGFQRGVAVKLTKSGSSDIICFNVTYVSSTKLTCSCNLTGSKSGSWTVTVTNPDTQTASLGGGFTVFGHSLAGYAWSETIGWVSFNCSNNSTCATADYGVDVDSVSGLFSGYAWSENTGWISFNTADLTGCPSGTCQAAITGGLTGLPKYITGWAKILSTGSFIHLSGTALDSSAYGAQLASNGSFSGYSWEPNYMGWLHWTGSLYGVTATW